MSAFKEQWYKVTDRESRQTFDMIPAEQKLHPNEDICAFMKVASLLKNGPESFDPHSEHDILYLCPVDELKDMTDDDIIYLSRCGVHYASDCDSLATFN